jgi:hypothetical protein
MNTAESDLQQFAAAVQEYSGLNNNDESLSQHDATAASTGGYAPIEPLNDQSYAASSANESPNVQTRRMRNTSNAPVMGTVRSPHQSRGVTQPQTRSNQTPSRNGSMAASNSVTQAQMRRQSDNMQTQQNSDTAQKQNSFDFINASSAFPNG